MRIIVAEDMAMMRDDIVRWCRQHRHTVVAETGSAAETLTLCREHRPDALLLDVRLEDGNGLDVAQRLRQEVPAVKIIFLTAYTTPYFIDKLAQAPVDGFIDKNTETCTTIGEALAAVARGEKWFSPTYHRARQQQQSDPNSFEKLLTPREQTILGMIGHSLSDAEIAAWLGIASRTVQYHRSNLMLKLKLDGTPKLIAFALENGFPSVLSPQAN